MCENETIIIKGKDNDEYDIHLTFTNSFQGKNIPLVKIERLLIDSLNSRVYSHGYIHLYKDEIDHIVEELVRKGYGHITNLEESIEDRKEAHDILVNKFMDKIKNNINKDGDVND